MDSDCREFLMKITEYKTYKEAEKDFTWDKVWEIFDGDKEHFNIAHECIDRHVGKGTAARIKFADGHSEQYSFDDISRLSSQFANALEEENIGFGDRVAIIIRDAPLWGIISSLAYLILHWSSMQAFLVQSKEAQSSCPVSPYSDRKRSSTESRIPAQKFFSRPKTRKRCLVIRQSNGLSPQASRSRIG